MNILWRMLFRAVVARVERLVTRPVDIACGAGV